MGIVGSTIAFLFRPRAPRPTEAQPRQRTATTLRPIVDSAVDVADCLSDNKPQKANDTDKAAPIDR